MDGLETGSRGQTGGRINFGRLRRKARLLYEEASVRYHDRSEARASAKEIKKVDETLRKPSRSSGALKEGSGANTVNRWSYWSYMFHDEREFKFARFAEELAKNLSSDLQGVNAEIRRLRSLLNTQHGELTSLTAKGNGFVREGFDAVGSKLTDIGKQLDAIRKQEPQDVRGELHDLRKEFEASRAQLDAMHGHLEVMRNMLEDIAYQAPHWVFDLKALCALEEHKQGVRVVRGEDGNPRVIDGEDEDKE